MALWEWKEEAPSTAEVMESLKSLRPIWGVETHEFGDFVLPMPRNEKVKVGKETRYVETWRLYMQVAGRVMMLNTICDGSREYTAFERLTIWPKEDTGGELPVIQVEVDLYRTLESGQYDKVRQSHGLAVVSRGDMPWEKAETAARGRALGALGIGVLPGTGIASLDEMQIMETYGVDLRPETRDVRDRTLEEVVEAVVLSREELRQMRDQDAEDLDDKLGAYVLSAFGISIRTDDGLDWSKLNKGKLLLVHSSLQTQIAAEVAKQTEVE